MSVRCRLSVRRKINSRMLQLRNVSIPKHCSRRRRAAHVPELHVSNPGVCIVVAMTDVDSSTCGVHGCDRGRYARGFCSTHYLRWYRTGSAGSAEIRPIRARSNMPVGYASVHGRLCTARGPASSHSCQHCGQPAAEWAYTNDCPDELIDDAIGLRYSIDPDRYIPLCRSCHKRFDRAHALLKSGNAPPCQISAARHHQPRPQRPRPRT
jgi:hypothetical protein